MRSSLILLIFICAAIPSATASPAGRTRHPPPSVSQILSKGINITDWFRNPISTSASSLGNYISERDIDQLARIGFTYIRIPITPNVLNNPDGSLNTIIVGILLDAARSIQRRGLGVMLVPMHDQWNLESSPGDRDDLMSFWKQFSPYLARLDVKLTFPELLNEPMFPDATAWSLLEQKLLSIVRSELPQNTIVLTGNQWGSIPGLLASIPLLDGNVVYSFHYYNPRTLTSHGNWDQTIDGSDLKRLPFPVERLLDCQRIVAAELDKRAKDLGNWYCKQKWDENKISKEIAAVIRWSKFHQVLVVATEFGIMADHERQSRLRYLAAVRTAFEINRIGWGLWGYDDSYGLAISPKDLPSLPALDTDVLNALGLTKRPVE